VTVIPPHITRTAFIL